MRSPLRSYRPAPINPSTSASISNCSTASATARRKSPSPAFSSSSANANLSSVIGSSPALQVKVLQLHLSRSAPMTTSNSPAARHCGSAQNSTTSVDANWNRTEIGLVFHLSLKVFAFKESLRHATGLYYMPAIVLAQVAFVSWVTRCCRLPLAGNKLARERHGLIEHAGAVLGRWLDLAALVPLVPRRYQYIVRRRSDRLL